MNDNRKFLSLLLAVLMLAAVVPGVTVSALIVTGPKGDVEITDGNDDIFLLGENITVTFQGPDYDEVEITVYNETGYVANLTLRGGGVSRKYLGNYIWEYTATIELDPKWNEGKHYLEINGTVASDETTILSKEDGIFYVGRLYLKAVEAVIANQTEESESSTYSDNIAGNTVYIGPYPVGETLVLTFQIEGIPYEVLNETKNNLQVNVGDVSVEVGGYDDQIINFTAEVTLTKPGETFNVTAGDFVLGSY